MGQLQMGWGRGCHTQRCQRVACGQETRPGLAPAPPGPRAPRLQLGSGSCCRLCTQHQSLHREPPVASETALHLHSVPPPGFAQTHYPSCLLLCSRCFSGTFPDPSERTNLSPTYPSLLLLTAPHCPAWCIVSSLSLPEEGSLQLAAVPQQPEHSTPTSHTARWVRGEGGRGAEREPKKR